MESMLRLCRALREMHRMSSPLFRAQRELAVPPVEIDLPFHALREVMLLHIV